MKRLIILGLSLALALTAAGIGVRLARGPAVDVAPVPSGSPSATPSAVPPGSPSPSPSPRPSPTATVPSPFPSPTKPTPAPTHTTPAPTTPPPSGGIPPSLVGTQWTKLPTSKKVVALTFDAGANADGVPSILQTLAQKGVPGTVFLTGKWVQEYPEYAAQIGARYPVANHSYSHPDLTTLSDAEVRAELQQGNDAIAAATGQDTHPIFRFPFGAADPRTISIVNALGYGAINWTVDTRGWQGTSGGQSADSVFQRVMDGLQPGEIVIMHVGSHPTDHSTLDADALPRVIDELRARGYGFATIDQYLPKG
jgi:peptidoglycan/xylan/chitin deacetylase (PgdA/CDA1 family)